MRAFILFCVLLAGCTGAVKDSCCDCVCDLEQGCVCVCRPNCECPADSDCNHCGWCEENK